MTRLLCLVLAAAVLAPAGPLPSEKAIDALVELRADREQDGKRIVCEHRAIAALTSEDPAELDAAEAFCDGAWGR
jgi:hypothetical protein